MTRIATGAAVAGAGVVGAVLRDRRARRTLRGSVAVVTGASRGLGFLVARELGRAECRLVICARDERELDEAARDLGRDAEVLAVRCDVGRRADVERLVAEALGRFGRVDVLVNNAGVIDVGPLETMTEDDFARALDVMFWGMVHPTLALLPHMRARRSGRIVNVTSIGGKISVPHLVPYGCAKFAAVGFSEGLRAELRRDGIRVVTVVPGLMRTGSHVNAGFKGRQEREYAWFALGATLPLVSMDAERAARAIARAAARGTAEVTLSVPAKLAARFHGVFPGAAADLLGLVNRFVLPAADGSRTHAVRGAEAERRLASPVVDALTRLGRSAARRFHQHPAPAPA
jgi:NAD(P)-dependent dehydrogenase (short-subunit alcohol dehydrogenase family)